MISLKDIFEKEFVMDGFGADLFCHVWNNMILQYGSISLYEVLTNPLLLGLVSSEAGIELKLIYHNYGWQDEISMVRNFEVGKGRKDYYYILKLPTMVVTL